MGKVHEEKAESEAYYSTCVWKNLVDKNELLRKQKQLVKNT